MSLHSTKGCFQHIRIKKASLFHFLPRFGSTHHSATQLPNHNASTKPQRKEPRRWVEKRRKLFYAALRFGGFFAGLCCIRYYSLPQSSGNDTPLCARIYPQFWRIFFVAFLRGYTFIRGFLFIFCSDFCPPNLFRS